MTKAIKGFFEGDGFITPTSAETSSILELSDFGNTYAKEKLVYQKSDNTNYNLTIFSKSGLTSLSQTEVDAIIQVLLSFNLFITTNVTANKQQTVILFTSGFNARYPEIPISDLSFNSTISYNNIKAPDYISFTVLGIDCNIWLSDSSFRTFYPDYDIDIILPFTT